MSDAPARSTQDDVPDPRAPTPLIARPALDRVLDSSDPVVAVVAPSGAGKTCAVQAWARRQAPADVCWLVATDVTAASLDRAGRRPAVVVVDDAHDLPCADLARVARLVEEPDGPRVVLVARREPDWSAWPGDRAPTASVVRHDRIRLDDAATARIVRALRPEAAERDVTRMVIAAGGWPGAAALIARDWPSVVHMAGTHGREVAPRLSARAGLLVDAALQSYDPDLALVLACACHEPHLTPEVAGTLSGHPRAATLLEDAADDGVLVTVRPGAGAGPGWRMHPVVSEVLRRRAEPGGPLHATLGAAHERAAAHAHRTGDLGSALRHATMSGRLEVHLEALHHGAPELLVRGEGDLVATALSRLPASVRDGTPAVLALDAMLVRTTGRPDAAKHLADRALALQAAASTGTAGAPSRAPAHARAADLDADLTVLEVWMARCGWRPPLVAMDRAARVLGCSSADDGAHDHDTTEVSALRSAGLMLDLAALELGHDRLPSAARHVHEVAAYARAAGLPVLVASAGSLQALLHLADDAGQSAAHTARAALAELDRAEADSPMARAVATRAHVVVALAHLQSLELDRAESELALAGTVTLDPFDNLMAAYRQVLSAHLAAARGDVDLARRLLDEAPRTADSLPRFARRHLAMARVAVAGRGGDLDAMATQAEQLRTSGQRQEAEVVEAIVTGADGDLTAAVARLDAILRPASGLPRPPRGVATAAEAARIAFLLRTQDPRTRQRAADLLPGALDRASAQRQWWTLSGALMVAPGLSDLLVHEAGRPDGHPDAASLLDAIRHALAPRSGSPDVSSAPPGDDVHDRAVELGLTSRELDVLHALAHGGTNRILARTLFVSENTVKTHLASLYRKLGVEGRTQALAAARSRGLL